MSECWRLLDFGEIDINTVLAVDEAILTTLSEGSSPNTIRFAQFKPPVVSLGYFQSVYDEIDLKACKHLNVGIARRLIGGGAAYEDFRGELTYGICVILPHTKIPMDFLPSYKVLTEGVITGLKYLGLDAYYVGINDVVVNGRKIGGVGQSRVRNALLQEGSVLFDDMSNMFKVLKISRMKIKDKGLLKPKDRVTNIKKELGEKIDLATLKKILIKGFEETLQIILSPGELNDNEKKMIPNLKKKYTSLEWIYQR